MRTIAKAAGISVSNTYNYYKSKEELLATVIEPVFNQLKDILKQSFQRSKGSGWVITCSHLSIDREIAHTTGEPGTAVNYHPCEKSADRNMKKAAMKS